LILAVLLSLILSFIHSLHLLQQWIVWESQHPNKRSILPERTPGPIQFFIKPTKSLRTVDNCIKTIMQSNYPSSKLAIKKITATTKVEEDPLEVKNLSVYIDSDVALQRDWIRTIQAQAQYNYLFAFQTPILFHSSDSWKDRVHFVRSLKFVMSAFQEYQQNKSKRFERTIYIQKPSFVGIEQQLTFLTYPEFVSFSSRNWNGDRVAEASYLQKYYPLYIVIHLLLGFFVNPLFGFIALLLFFIYAIVDYLIVSKLAAFYKQPKACKWYILSFIISIFGYQWLR